MWVGREEEKYLKRRSEMQCIACRGNTEYKEKKEKLNRVSMCAAGE
jgi:hypothetical protein